MESCLNKNGTIERLRNWHEKKYGFAKRKMDFRSVFFWTDWKSILRRTTEVISGQFLISKLPIKTAFLCFIGFIFSSTANAAEILNVAQTGTDVVVVVPTAWQTSLSKWQDFRRRQGYKIELVTPETTAEETRTTIQRLAKETGNKVNYIVLAADAPDFRNTPTDQLQTDTVPTFYVDSQVVVNFGSAPTIASDYPYSLGPYSLGPYSLGPNSDRLNSENRNTIVGRIPASDSRSLADYCDRVIRYEIEKPPDRSLKQIDVVAGVGGFGAVTDTIVENMTGQLLSEDIPHDYQMSMMYASPSSVYCPSPIQFSETAIKRFNRGSLFWIYLGHGFVDTLDMIPFEDRLLPIFTRDQIQELDVTGLPPIAILLACYVGAFDAPGGCLAEQMVMHAGGPVATISGSRVTMPYGMAVLGRAMLEATFKDTLLSIGEILSESKKRSLTSRDPANELEPFTAPKEVASASRRELLDTLAAALSPADHDIALERNEHCYLFNLLGDPLLRISRPTALEFTSTKTAIQGDLLNITCNSPIDGSCEIEIAYPRQRIPDKAKSLRDAFQKDNTNRDLQQRVFEEANETTITRKIFPVTLGTFKAELSTENFPTGRLTINVSIYGTKTWRSGSSPIQIKKKFP